MVTDPTPRTLYDDWKARRERLAWASGGIAGHQAVELRLLDYLLRRYQASPEAARPARFPLPASVFVDHRAIVVHHHLGRGQIPSITNEQEARDHVHALVDRMWSPSARKETTDADAGIASCAIPPPADPVEAARTKLCHNDPVVRIHAAVELGAIGDLDDIGLLSDLLSLPACPDEHPRERESLVHAMQRLSGVATRPFDLRGVPPVPEAPKCHGARGADFWLVLLVVAAICFIVGWIIFSLMQ